MLTRWRTRARTLRRDTLALYLAAPRPTRPLGRGGRRLRHHRLRPQPHRPDPRLHPVLGYLDDLLIVPAGLLLARRLIPDAIIEQHRHTAAQPGVGPSRLGLAIVIIIWLLSALFVAALVLRLT